MAILAEEIKIKIDGETLEGYYFTDIQLVQELQKPNELRFRINRNKLAESDKEIRFSLSKELLGKDVDFSLTTVKDGDSEGSVLEFSGTIFNINILRNKLKANTVIEVTAYSRDYVLLDSPNCFSYEKKKLKDIVAETLKPYDISVKNNPRMEEEIPYTVQYNETSYEFLNRLARRYGEWVYLANDELVFGKIEKSDSLQLHFGKDVTHYKHCLEMGHPNFTHAHHNYFEYGNTKKKGTEFSGDDMHNLTDIVYEQSKSLFSKETFQHLNSSNPEDGFDETETSAKVQGLSKKAQMMICQGKSNRADLRLGSVIKIKEGYDKDEKAGEIAWCFHDELIIHKLVHNVSKKDSYENEFMAVSANCEIPPYNYGDCQPKAQQQRAVVKDNKDPEKLGRVRVQFLWQKEQDENLMTPWIRIAQPHGGENKGFHFVPEIEEEVMVGFENGNAEKPYVIGMLYHGNQKPAEYDGYDDNVTKYICTKNGHRILFIDKDDGGRIEITDGNDDEFKYSIILDTDDKLIQLRSKGSIRMYAEKDIYMEAKESIILKADKNIDMEAEEKIITLSHGDTQMSADGDLTTASDGNTTMNVKGDMEIEVEGKQKTFIYGEMELTPQGTTKIETASDLTVKGINITMESNANTEVKANAAMTVKGSATGEFDGGGMTTVKGGMIQVG